MDFQSVTFAQRSDIKNNNQPVRVNSKICLLGDGAVGKTSLIRRFVENMFNEDYLLTIGTRTSKKKIIIKKPEFQNDFHINLIIWDIMGQLSFRKLFVPKYIKGARGAILVCDLTNRETLERLDDWMDLKFVEWGEIPLIFIANKCDLKDQFEFKITDIEGIASDFDAPFFITSAKTGENVENAFNTLV